MYILAPPAAAKAASRDAVKNIKLLVFLVKRMRQVRGSIGTLGSEAVSSGQEDTVRYTKDPEALIRLAARYELDIDSYERFFPARRLPGFQAHSRN